MDNSSNSTSYETLLEQFELTKKQLGDAEENIRRITGRDPDQFANDVRGGPGLNKWRSQPGVTFAKQQFIGKNKRPLFPIVKGAKEETAAQDEESVDEDEVPAKRPSLPSTVVATPKDVKSRRETIQEQNINSKVKARNRRMFGMILGTLQKFQHDAKKREEKDLRRAEIEQKVEAAAAEERERIKKEKEELFQTRKEKQIQLRCLEKKMEIAELHEVWENNQKHLVNFLVTTTQPPICYLPAIHTPETEKRLLKSKTETLESENFENDDVSYARQWCELDKETPALPRFPITGAPRIKVPISKRIRERREKMEKELLEVESWYKKDNFPSDKENIGPMEDSEINELTDNCPATQDSHQELSSTLLVSQDTQPELPDTQHNPNQDFQNISEEMQINVQEHVDNPSEMLTDETETTVANEETLANGQSDQDFEPIYD